VKYKHMALRVDLNSYMPNTVQWVMIGVFLVGALALIPQYITVSQVTVGYIALASGLIALALKIFTTVPAEPQEAR